MSFLTKCFIILYKNYAWKSFKKQKKLQKVVIFSSFYSFIIITIKIIGDREWKDGL